MVGDPATTLADAERAAAWNAAIEAVHHLISEAADGHGDIWQSDDGAEVDGGNVLDRLPNAIWSMRR